MNILKNLVVFSFGIGLSVYGSYESSSDVKNFYANRSHVKQVVAQRVSGNAALSQCHKEGFLSCTIVRSDVVARDPRCPECVNIRSEVLGRGQRVPSYFASVQLKDASLAKRQANLKALAACGAQDCKVLFSDIVRVGRPRCPECVEVESVAVRGR